MACGKAVNDRSVQRSALAAIARDNSFGAHGSSHAQVRHHFLSNWCCSGSTSSAPGRGLCKLMLEKLPEGLGPRTAMQPGLARLEGAQGRGLGLTGTRPTSVLWLALSMLVGVQEVEDHLAIVCVRCLSPGVPARGMGDGFRARVTRGAFA